MGILLGFALFVAFAVAATLWGGMIGLMAGAVISAALVMRELLRKHPPKILEIGTFLMFAGLFAWSKLFPSDLSVLGVRFRVDLGLLCVILVSLVIGKPFTLQYARERVSAERATSSQFAKINFVITSVWALAFVCIVIADVLMAYVPTVPIRVGIVVTVLALVGAYKFTGWYPKRVTQPK
jgi:hypothetical protein